MQKPAKQSSSMLREARFTDGLGTKMGRPAGAGAFIGARKAPSPRRGEGWSWISEAPKGVCDARMSVGPALDR